MGVDGGIMGESNSVGCLNGSEGNYTIVEDGTGQIFKITTTNADLKPHLGHDGNSFSVSELSMIFEHCAAAAVAPAATVGPSSAPFSTIPVDATLSCFAGRLRAWADGKVGGAASTAGVVTSSEDGFTVTAAGTEVSTAGVLTDAEDGVTVAAGSGDGLEVATGVAASAAGGVTVSEDGLTVAAGSVAAATLLWLLILFAVLVIALGMLAPLLSRWRKRKILERTGTPNLSFTNETISDEGKPEPRKVA